MLKRSEEELDQLLSKLIDNQNLTKIEEEDLKNALYEKFKKHVKQYPKQMKDILNWKDQFEN